MLEVEIGSRKYKVKRDGATGKIELASGEVKPDIVMVRENHYSMILEGKSYNIEVVEQSEKTPVIKVNGIVYKPTIRTETDLLLEKLGINTKSKKTLKELKAPMPGLVVDYKVSVGDEVLEGSPLVVLEAMKMENILKAPADVKVKELNAKKGEAIDKNTILITFE